MRRIWMALMGIAIAATLATEPSVHRLVAQNPPTEEEDVCRRSNRSATAVVSAAARCAKALAMVKHAASPRAIARRSGLPGLHAESATPSYCAHIVLHRVAAWVEGCVSGRGVRGQRAHVTSRVVAT